VQRRAADGVLHRVNRAARNRRGGGVRARGRNFLVRLLHTLRPAAIVVAQFVRREVATRQPRAGFETDHLEPCLRERQRHHATGRAEADDDDVGVLESGRHHCAPVFAAAFVNVS
jgi:hypothetical protein